eukprot:TRINITY_DN9220_c0_g1_i1.p1 TRINITY_DN9220_c0_g1~~TRINITY_DN9220_c0_g1_i1.p1  ORF type:complete len:429 (+),score=159.47 TRINITY_DN9220_c0_g1_i1:191-1288(+)
MMRIDDPERKIYNFLKSCDCVYPRFSTHMVERLKETLEIDGSQRGLDLKGQNLPAGKSTVLFFPMFDGTTMIKLEKHGCPPFWQKEFMSVENTLEFYKHSKDYIKSRVVQNPDPRHRRENLPKEWTEAFSKALHFLYPSLPMNLCTFQTSSKKQNPKEKLFIYGKTYGVTTMIKILLDHTNDVEKSEILHSFLQDDPDFHLHCALNINPSASAEIWKSIEEVTQAFCKIQLEDKEKGYLGERKGNEASLPNPKYWEEYEHFNYETNVAVESEVDEETENEMESEDWNIDVKKFEEEIDLCDGDSMVEGSTGEDSFVNLEDSPTTEESVSDMSHTLRNSSLNSSTEMNLKWVKTSVPKVINQDTNT